MSKWNHVSYWHVQTFLGETNQAVSHLSSLFCLETMMPVKDTVDEETCSIELGSGDDKILYINSCNMNYKHISTRVIGGSHFRSISKFI